MFAGSQPTGIYAIMPLRRGMGRCDAYDILYAPLAFTMFMHLCLSEIVVHRLWPNRDENGKSKENILYDEDG